MKFASQTIAALLFTGLWTAGAGAVSQNEQPTLDQLLEIESPMPPGAAASSPAGQGSNTKLRELLDQVRAPDEMRMALKEMKEASEQLDQNENAGIETQRLQASVLARLDALIEEAKSQCSKCKKSGKSSSVQMRPADTGSSANAGATASAQPAGNQENSGSTTVGRPRPAQLRQTNIEETRSEWGNLPPRIRDELLQGLRERFSHIYRTLTEDYYRHLADRRQQ